MEYELPNGKKSDVYFVLSQYKIVKNCKYGVVCSSAVSNLTDLNVLADVVKNDGDCNVRREAVSKLTDQVASVYVFRFQVVG